MPDVVDLHGHSKGAFDKNHMIGTEVVRGAPPELAKARAEWGSGRWRVPGGHDLDGCDPLRARWGSRPGAGSRNSDDAASGLPRLYLARGGRGSDSREGAGHRAGGRFLRPQSPGLQRSCHWPAVECPPRSVVCPDHRVRKPAIAGSTSLAGPGDGPSVARAKDGERARRTDVVRRPVD